MVAGNNPTWRQHYLPAVYLQQFSVDGSQGGRGSMVWRLSSRINQDVVVEDQCYERFYNSESDPARAEAVFQNYEGLYGQLAQRIWRHEEAESQRNYFGLVAFMISLHFRNPAYANRTKDERIAVYVDLEGEFLVQSLGVRVNSLSPSLEHLQLFTDAWDVRLMTAEEAPLLTSDNPSMVFHQDELPRLIILPVTPGCIAVAFDKRCFPSIHSQSLTRADIERMNRLQIHSCVKAVFSSEQIKPDDEAEIRKCWTTRTPPPGFVDFENWGANYRGMEPFDFLSRSL